MTGGCRAGRLTTQKMRIEKIASVENWTKKRMVSLLKRAGLNECRYRSLVHSFTGGGQLTGLRRADYEHSHHFISVLSGKPVPFRISQETFDTLLQMFEKVRVYVFSHYLI